MLNWLVPRSYDIFVSYKSHDVRLARAVADQMIAAGKRVWFAEYQILLRRYEKFQAAIDHGIGRSRYGLAFTNDRYADSEHCQREMSQLLERCGPTRVLEVRVPDEPRLHRMFPLLGESPAHIGDRVNEILDFVNRHTGWAIPHQDLQADDGPRQDVESTCMDWRYRLDATGWTQTKPGGQRLVDWGRSEWRVPLGGNVLRHLIAVGQIPISLDGPELRLDREGPPLMMNLHAGPEFSSNARSSELNPDDREMYRELMGYIPRHLRRLHFARLRGLHLFFHGGGSQMAVTYRWAGYWTRKYSIIVPHPKSYILTEFVFTFGFKGTFGEYCRLTHFMDEIVSSLQWCEEGRFIAYYPVTDRISRADFEASRVLGICLTREEAKEVAETSKLRAFVWSEPSFVAEYGAAGKQKILDYERDQEDG